MSKQNPKWSYQIDDDNVVTIWSADQTEAPVVRQPHVADPTLAQEGDKIFRDWANRDEAETWAKEQVDALNAVEESTDPVK